jgi:hypothetical protein
VKVLVVAVRMLLETVRVHELEAMIVPVEDVRVLLKAVSAC